jgi:hypothetical protein
MLPTGNSDAALGAPVGERNQGWSWWCGSWGGWEGKNRGGRGINGWAHTHVTPLFFIRKDTHQMLDAGIRTSDPRGMLVLKITS